MAVSPAKTGINHGVKLECRFCSPRDGPSPVLRTVGGHRGVAPCTCAKLSIPSGCAGYKGEDPTFSQRRKVTNAKYIMLLLESTHSLNPGIYLGRVLLALGGWVVHNDFFE